MKTTHSRRCVSNLVLCFFNVSLWLVLCLFYGSLGGVCQLVTFLCWPTSVVINTVLRCVRFSSCVITCAIIYSYIYVWFNAEATTMLCEVCCCLDALRPTLTDASIEEILIRHDLRLINEHNKQNTTQNNAK